MDRLQQTQTCTHQITTTKTSIATGLEGINHRYLSVWFNAVLFLERSSSGSWLTKGIERKMDSVWGWAEAWPVAERQTVYSLGVSTNLLRWHRTFFFFFFFSLHEQDSYSQHHAQRFPMIASDASDRTVSHSEHLQFISVAEMSSKYQRTTHWESIEGIKSPHVLSNYLQWDTCSGLSLTWTNFSMVLSTSMLKGLAWIPLRSMWLRRLWMICRSVCCILGRPFSNNC